LYPAPFLRAMETSVANVIQTVEKGSAAKAVQPKRAAAGQPGNQATGQLGGSENRLIAESPNRRIAASHDREGGR